MEPIVIQQISSIKETGETNMFDTNKVMEIALREGFYELADYLWEHTKEYSRFILTGKED